MEFGLGSDKNPVDIQMSIEVVLGGFGMDGSPETILWSKHRLPQFCYDWMSIGNGIHYQSISILRHHFHTFNPWHDRGYRFLIGDDGIFMHDFMKHPYGTVNWVVFSFGPSHWPNITAAMSSDWRISSYIRLKFPHFSISFRCKNPPIHVVHYIKYWKLFRSDVSEPCRPCLLKAQRYLNCPRLQGEHVCSQ